MSIAPAPAGFAQGARQTHSPAVVSCFLGLTAYRAGFDQPKAQLGRQPEDLHGATVWLLPNPSGLNAHYQAADYARLFREVRLACLTPRVSPRGSTRGSNAARRA